MLAGKGSAVLALTVGKPVSNKLADVERAHIEAVIRAYPQHNKRDIAMKLGIAFETFRRKLKKHGIPWKTKRGGKR